MAVRYFDLNGATAGFGTLTGAWNTSSAFWSTSSAGTATPAAYTFTSADSANFGFSGTTATAGTATIANAVTVTLNNITTANLSGLQTIARTGTGALTIAGTSPSITANSAGGLTISAPIGGTTAWTSNGSGVLTLTGDNTFNNTVTVSAGTLNANSATALGTDTSSVTLTSGAALSIGAALNYSTRNWSIGGTGATGVDGGSVILAYAGTVKIGSSIGATNNTYIRATADGAGLSSNISWSSGLSGQGLRLGAATGTTATFSGAISVSSGTLVALLFGRSNNPDLGTVVLTGSNTFAAPTQIDYGTLRISSDANLGTAPVAETAAYLVIGGSTTLATTANFTLSVNRGIALGPSTGSGTGTTDVANATTLTYAGIIANNGTGTGNLAKTNTGTLVLSGANTFTGTVTVSAGTLNANSATALGAASSTAAISVASGATLSLGAALDYSSPGRTTTINSTGVSTGGALIHNYAGAANIGSITLGSASYVRGTATGTSTLSSSFTNAGFALTTGAASGNTLTLTGGISGLGGLVIGNSSSDTGTVALTTAKTYQGNTTLSYGTLSVGNAGALGSVGSLAFNGGTLDASVSGLTIVNAFTLPYGVLYFAGTNSMELSANINIGSGTPSIRVSASTLTLSGLISGSGGSLDVSGSSSGTLRLLNGSNSYSGGTGIYSPVSFANGALGSAGSITLVNSSLKWDSGNTQDVSSRLILSSIYATFDAGGNARVPFASAFGNNATTDIHTNGTATGGQTGVIDFRGANTFTGDVWVDTGSLWAAGSAALGPNRASTVRIASGGSLTIYSLSAALDYSLLTINLRGAGNSTDAGALVLSNAYSVNMGSIVLQEDAAILGRMTAALTSGVDLSGRTLTLRSTSVNSTFIQGNITSSSSGSLVVGGGTYTGTVKLTGTNTHKNGTTISTGTLQAGSVQALGTVGTVSLSSGATLQTLTSGFSGQNGKLTVAALNNASGGTIKIGG